MSIYTTFLKMIRSGLAGAWKEIDDYVHSRAHRVVLKMAFATFAAGWFSAVAAAIMFFVHLDLTPYVLLGLALGCFVTVADYAALQVIYAGVKWFYFAGRQDEMRAERKRETQARRRAYGDQAA